MTQPGTVYNEEYLRKSYETAKEVSKYLGWNVVS